MTLAYLQLQKNVNLISFHAAIVDVYLKNSLVMAKMIVMIILMKTVVHQGTHLYLNQVNYVMKKKNLSAKTNMDIVCQLKLDAMVHQNVNILRMN